MKWEYTSLISSDASDELGSKGWELVSVIDWSNGLCKFFYKRQIQ